MHWADANRLLVLILKLLGALPLGLGTFACSCLALHKYSRYLDGLNTWSQSWCQANPVNGGCNWLCGQETSIRLIHALQAWQLANPPGQLPVASPQRAAFVASHLQRIAATERYAQAQDNNHWTSEAAALFIGGSWLAASDSDYVLSGLPVARGRRSLELSVARLVMADGSFAQHSLTYHRTIPLLRLSLAKQA